MTKAKYDTNAKYYSDFVASAFASPTSVLRVVSEQVIETLGNPEGSDVCDVACGEGHLARYLAQRGALVTGVDISEHLLDKARAKTPQTFAVTYLQDDAQSLTKLKSQSFDAVTINMALMDISNHKRTFESCQRILKPGGRFIFSILHPCFESPFDTENPPVEVSESDDFVACRVSRYLEEGFWTSGGDGIRGKVGAYHRTLSTYLNDLLASGFRLEAILEPSLSEEQYETLEEQWFSKVPRGLVVKSVKV